MHERLVRADAEKVQAWTISFDREGRYLLILMPKGGKGGAAIMGKTIFVLAERIAIGTKLERW